MAFTIKVDGAEHRVDVDADTPLPRCTTSRSSLPPLFGAASDRRTLKNGRVEQTNFNTYRVLRMNEAPAIEVYLVKNNEAPGGMGEPGTSAIVPASRMRSLLLRANDRASCRLIRRNSSKRESK